MSARWPAVMPVIELARCVPVLDNDNGTTGAVVGVEERASWPWARRTATDQDGTYAWVVWDDSDGESVFEERTADLRVDLGDPAGFAYALRWLSRRLGSERWRVTAWAVEAWLLSRTTDADRLALAQACAEVAP